MIDRCQPTPSAVSAPTGPSRVTGPTPQSLAWGPPSRTPTPNGLGPGPTGTASSLGGRAVAEYGLKACAAAWSAVAEHGLKACAAACCGAEHRLEAWPRCRRQDSDLMEPAVSDVIAGGTASHRSASGRHSGHKLVNTA